MSIDAIILAGGKGTRLRAAVSDVPKPMAPILGRPFLDYQLIQMAGDPLVASVTLAVGHMGDIIIRHYADRPPPLPVRWTVEEALLGTGGGARRAAQMTHSDKVLVVNGDTLVAWSAGPLAEALERAGADAAMGVVRVDDCSRYGRVDVADGLIRAFHEKEDGAGAGLISCGVYIFRRAALDALAPDAVVSLEHDVFPGLAARGALAAVVFDSEFLDIGLPETYAIAPDVVGRIVGAGGEGPGGAAT